MDIFRLTAKFPKAERYALTDQILRSSRAVTANFAEGHKARAYKKVFRLRLTSCHSENAETKVWLDFAHACHYISEEEYEQLRQLNNEIGRLIFYMLKHMDRYTF